MVIRVSHFLPAAQKSPEVRFKRPSGWELKMSSNLEALALTHVRYFSQLPGQFKAQAAARVGLAGASPRFTGGEGAGRPTQLL